MIGMESARDLLLILLFLFLLNLEIAYNGRKSNPPCNTYETDGPQLRLVYIEISDIHIIIQVESKEKEGNNDTNAETWRHTEPMQMSVNIT